MVSAMDQRKCWLMLLLFAYQVCLPDSVQAVAMNGTEVSRRQNGDVSYFNDGSNMICNVKNSYLISECQCVNDQELFKSNDFYYIEPLILYL